MNRIARAAVSAVFAFGVAAAPALADTAPAAGEAAAEAQETAFTAEQIAAFAAASNEIEPVQRAANGAALTQQQIEQIRASLERHNLDSATYNAIAQAAREDEALATRIAELRAADGGGAGSD